MDPAASVNVLSKTSKSKSKSKDAAEPTPPKHKRTSKSSVKAVVGATEATVEEPPKHKRTSKSSVKAVVGATEATVEEPPKHKRTSKSSVKEVVGATEATVEEPPKPKRTHRSKDAAEDTPPKHKRTSKSSVKEVVGATEASVEEPPKPKRNHRSKDAAEDTPTKPKRTHKSKVKDVIGVAEEPPKRTHKRKDVVGAAEEPKENEETEEAGENEETTKEPPKPKRTHKSKVKPVIDDDTEDPPEMTRNNKAAESAYDSTEDSPELTHTNTSGGKIELVRKSTPKHKTDTTPHIVSPAIASKVSKGKRPVKSEDAKPKSSIHPQTANIATPQELYVATTMTSLPPDTTINVLSSVVIRNECDMFPALKDVITKTVEPKYMSAHYVQFRIANTTATTCNFIRQQLMATPTIRLYAAYSAADGVDHSKMNITCKYCPFWQYIVDNIKLIPIYQKIPTDSVFSLHVENNTNKPLMVYSTDIVRAGGNTTPMNKYPICEISQGSLIHIDNIMPITGTGTIHASHSNVAHIRVTNINNTDELVNDVGTYDMSFKLLEGVLPRDFIGGAFTAILARLADLYKYLDSGRDGIVHCRTYSDSAQYTVRFTESLSYVQYIVRLAQYAGHAIGTNMNPDDVCASAYSDNIVDILKIGCQLASRDMTALKAEFDNQLRA